MSFSGSRGDSLTNLKQALTEMYLPSNTEEKYIELQLLSSYRYKFSLWLRSSNHLYFPIVLARKPNHPDQTKTVITKQINNK